MFELYGIYETVDVNFCHRIYRDEHRVLVATFDSEEDAEKYREASRLKHTTGGMFLPTVGYKSTSLLRGCAHAEIVEKSDRIIPHNPKL